MPRPYKSEIGPGLFLRSKVYWLRYTPTDGGPQVRRSLGTRKAVDAITLADKLRGKPLTDKKAPQKWDLEVKTYLKKTKSETI